MAVLRALIAGALIMGCLAGPVYAQQKKENPLKVEEDQRRKDGEAIDRQYKAALERERKNAPEAKVVNDPWQSMRGADDSKPKR
jgi:hypothetical protein